MNGDERDDTRTYKVVVNHEERYSIWPTERANPLGWRDAGKTGLRAECLEYIERVWTDMRPLSLRTWMDGAATRAAPAADAPRGEAAAGHGRTGSVLVDRLCEGEHPVEASLRPERTVERFRQSIDDDYIHIRFTDSRGGTELGVRLDRGRSDLGGADFERQTGSVILVGTLTLDGVRVRCVATIELPGLAGHGRLEVVED